MDLLERVQQRPQRRGAADLTLEEKLGARAVHPEGQQTLREGGLITVCEHLRWVGVMMRGSGSSQWSPVQWAQIEVQKIKQFGN